MSKADILYVKNAGRFESEDETDIWDDRKLNDAYDKALRMANAEVAKRIAMTTNGHKKFNDPANKSKKSMPKSHNASEARRPKEEWGVGMSCRAVYEGDGREYEAIVSRIINDKECVVKFIGYDNSEIVAIDTLKCSKGDEAQTSQIEQALLENSDSTATPSHRDMDLSSDFNQSNNSADKFQRKSKMTKKKKDQQHFYNVPEMTMPNFCRSKNFQPEMPAFGMDMPMPPPLPLPASSTESEDQAISSMLLSWYMSGYYTGLYQGIKRAKQNRRNSKY